MPTVVKLFVFQPNGEKIGTLVLDLESLFQMWRDQMHARLAAQAAEVGCQDGAPPAGVPITEHLEWVEDEEGIHLRPRAQRPSEENPET